MTDQTPNAFLRNTLATIAYRFQKSVSQSSDEFGSFSPGNRARTTSEIVNHMYHVLRSTKEFIQNGEFSKEAPSKLTLKEETDRFNSELRELDSLLLQEDLGISYANRLFQGPLSDILTHIGQISMMSRLNGSPISGEDFSSAPIEIGRLNYF